MTHRPILHQLAFLLLACLLAGGHKAAAQAGPHASLPPLFAYRNGRILTFSEDNQFWPAFQDRQGFLWGTDQYRLGKVARYDGYEVEAFPLAPSDTAGVQCLGEVQFFPDSEGKIWLAIDWCGLDRYDPETGRFEHFNDDIFAVR
ncbi:MAG: hypothetical protein J5I94_28740, partial [Phaeodactylibacter sp.]|nr:hypothetical protein [Phaeodactylibacter sp.]